MGSAIGHWMAMQNSHTTQGDHTAEESAVNWTATTGSWAYLDAVLVRPPVGTSAVVALGDSITDGWQSTTDLDRRWPDYLARRLQSALNRLRRDVLSQPGVRTVFLFEGVNDLKAHTGVTAQDLIAGYRRIADRVHAAGKCLVVATVAPFKGWSEWDPAAEAVRQEANAFLRGRRDFDAVTDFDHILRRELVSRPSARAR